MLQLPFTCHACQFAFTSAIAELDKNEPTPEVLGRVSAQERADEALGAGAKASEGLTPGMARGPGSRPGHAVAARAPRVHG